MSLSIWNGGIRVGKAIENLFSSIGYFYGTIRISICPVVTAHFSRGIPQDPVTKAAIMNFTYFGSEKDAWVTLVYTT